MSEPPRRPAVVAYGIPFLAVVWLLLVGWFLLQIDPMSGQANAGMAFWTAIWCTVLYRAWRGGPMALNAVMVLCTYIPGLVLVGMVVMFVAVGREGTDFLGRMPTSLWGALVAYACVFAVGLRLRGADVREWSIVMRPPRTRAEAALAGQVTAGAHPGGTSGVPAVDAEPMTVDLGVALRKQAKARAGCFGLLLCFMPGFPLVATAVNAAKDGYQPVLYMAGFLLVLVVALVISVVRFQRRLGARSVLTIDEDGVTWEGASDRAEISWNALAGVGISFYTVHTKSGQKSHMQQLEIFEQPQSPLGRWPELDRFRRSEMPPPGVEVQLPEERYRIMLPASDPVHRQIESAVQTFGPGVWLGWYERGRSDTPWFLR